MKEPAAFAALGLWRGLATLAAASAAWIRGDLLGFAESKNLAGFADLLGFMRIRRFKIAQRFADSPSRWIFGAGFRRDSPLWIRERDLRRGFAVGFWSAIFGARFLAGFAAILFAFLIVEAALARRIHP